MCSFRASQWVLKGLRVCLSSTFCIRKVVRELDKRLTLELRVLVPGNPSRSGLSFHS